MKTTHEMWNKNKVKTTLSSILRECRAIALGYIVQRAIVSWTATCYRVFALDSSLQTQVSIEQWNAQVFDTNAHTHSLARHKQPTQSITSHNVSCERTTKRSEFYWEILDNAGCEIKLHTHSQSACVCLRCVVHERNRVASTNETNINGLHRVKLKMVSSERVEKRKQIKSNKYEQVVNTKYVCVEHCGYSPSPRTTIHNSTMHNSNSISLRHWHMCAARFESIVRCAPLIRLLITSLLLLFWICFYLYAVCARGKRTRHKLNCRVTEWKHQKKKKHTQSCNIPGIAVAVVVGHVSYCVCSLTRRKREKQKNFKYGIFFMVPLDVIYFFCTSPPSLDSLQWVRVFLSPFLWCVL